MLNNLKSILNESCVTFKLYRAAFEDWLVATDEEKKEYHDARTKHVLSFGGVFFDQGTTLQTSGTSTGLCKKYIWGPNFEDAHKFHDYLCLGDIDYDIIIELFLTFTRDFCVITEGRRRHHSNCHVVLGSPCFDTFAKIQDFVKAKTSKPKVVVRVLPTQANIVLANNNEFFSYFDPNKFVFHATGETCQQHVKEHFANLQLTLRDTMKVWNGGASFFTCSRGNIHWDDFTCRYHEDSENDLVCTDLFNLSQVFYKIPTGDKVIRSVIGICDCGLSIYKNDWQDRFSMIRLKGVDYNWNELRNDVIRGLSTVSGTPIDDWWNILLGLSLGVAPNTITIFYETLKEINEELLLAAEQHLTNKWQRLAIFSKGLQHNRFKTKRVFLMDKDPVPVKIL
jgi:hypothetical protein